MRRLFFLVLIFWLLSAPVEQPGATPQVSLWQEAIEHYQATRYLEALRLFQILQGQSDHWRVHYNIGNCLLNLGNPLEAKIAYLKAWRTRPGLERLNHNIQLANARMGLAEEELERTVMERLFFWLDQRLSASLISAALFLALLTLNLALLFWIRGRWTRLARYSTALSLLLTLLLSWQYLSYHRSWSSHDLAVVTTDQAALYSGLGDHHTLLFNLSRGTTLQIRERSQQWIRVDAGPDRSGWIRRDWLSEINGR